MSDKMTDEQKQAIDECFKAFEVVNNISDVLFKLGMVLEVEVLQTGESGYKIAPNIKVKGI